MRFMSLLSFFIFTFFSVFSQKLDLDLFAKNVILINPDNNAILYEKNANEKAFPASITKVATALYILDNKKHLIDEYTQVSAEALHPVLPNDKVNNNYNYPAYWLETDGSKFGLFKGENISLRTLLYGLLLVSGNDCANVLAEACSDSVPFFMKDLNTYIESLDCKNTMFCNPHGLHHPDHYTTAYDMAMITKKALEMPYFRRLVSTQSYTTSKTNKHSSREISQYNRLMKEGRHYYPYAIGVKTGFHSNAGYNLIAAAEYENRTLIVVLMGGVKNEQRYIDARRLFDAAFAQNKETKVIFNKDKIFKANIEGAKTQLKAYLEEAFVYEYYPAEVMDYKVFVKWNDLKLPIAKDSKVGEMQIISEKGIVLSSSSLYSTDKIKRTFSTLIKDIFKKVL